MLLSRALNVYPNAWLCNLTRKPAKKIPMAYQHIMYATVIVGWWVACAVRQWGGVEISLVRATTPIHPMHAFTA
jgi:hypothetical protein